ncbi:MAG: alcohol dehydrogenase catalytic domain-containing protein [Chloroflexi bacterium]|nr:alcohol dehydrogenase catalytic domain-containing protein [Chloroflexota bacterium]
MQALVFLGTQQLELREVPRPEPGPGEVLVRVAAAGICGSELEAYIGASDRRVGPLILGHELAGTVVRAPGDGSGPAEGARVAVNPLTSCGECATCRAGHPYVCPDRRLLSLHLDGGHAEYVAVPAEKLSPLADGVPFQVACLAEPAATALHAVADLPELSRSTVLVVGCGSIGLLTLQAARRAGARRVVALDRIEARRRLAADLGAETPELTEIADGSIDVVVDTVGVEATRQLAVRAAVPGGDVRLVGQLHPTSELDFRAVIAKGLKLSGVYAYTDAQFHEALGALVDGSLATAPFTQTFPLTEGAVVFHRLAEHPDELVKAVLMP